MIACITLHHPASTLTVHVWTHAVMSSYADKHAVQLPMQISSAAPESSSCCLQSCLAAAVSCQACLTAGAKQASRTQRTGKAGSKVWSCSLIASVCPWKPWCASPRPLLWSRRKSLLSLRCAPLLPVLLLTFDDVGYIYSLFRTTKKTHVDNCLVCCTTPVGSIGSQISLSLSPSSYLCSTTSTPAHVLLMGSRRHALMPRLLSYALVNNNSKLLFGSIIVSVAGAEPALCALCCDGAAVTHCLFKTHYTSPSLHHLVVLLVSLS